MPEWASPYLSQACCCGEAIAQTCLEPLQLSPGLSQSTNTTEKPLICVISLVPSMDLEAGSPFLPHVVITKAQLP